MKKPLIIVSLFVLLTVSLSLAGCGAAATTTPAQQAPTQAPAPTEAPAATTPPANPTTGPVATEAPTTAPAEAPTSTPVPQASGKKVTLQWWNWYTDMVSTYNEKLFPEFQKLHPEVTIEYRALDYGAYFQTLKTAMAAGEGPDLFSIYPISNLVELVKANQVVNLQPIVTGAWRDRLMESGLRECSINGDLYLLPYEVNNYGILYSKALLKKNGLPEPPGTLDETKAWAKQVSATGLVPWLVGLKDRYQGGDLFFFNMSQLAPEKVRQADLGQISWEDPDIIRAFEIIAEMNQSGLFGRGSTGVASQDAMSAFYAQKGAVLFGHGSWALGADPQAMSDFGPDNYGILDYPEVKPGATRVSIGGFSRTLALNANSKHQKEALEFMNWLTDTWAQQDFVLKVTKNIPIMKGLDAKTVVPDDQFLQYFVKTQENAATRELFTPELNEALQDQVSLIMDSKVTPAQAAANMEKVSKSVQR